MNNNQQAFFALVRAGLFPVNGAGLTVKGSFQQDVDWDAVLQIATDQSVVGLATAGIEPLQGWLRDNGLPLIPKTTVLQFIGQTQYIEQQNKDMNAFVIKLIGKLREAGINAVLVKGQGIAQCYERPLWRTPGDVDLLLSGEDYEKAKALLLPIASEVEPEFVFLKHLGMTISGWTVELHGTLRPRLTKRVDCMVEALQKEVLDGGKVRTWTVYGEEPALVNGEGIKVNASSRDVEVALPAPDEDVIFVFTHILKHFYFEGVGLRQICDWCRLLYTYRDSLDYGLLESRLQEAGLMTEWKAFGALAVKYLGMNPEYVPFLGPMFNVRGFHRRHPVRLGRVQTSLTLRSPWADVQYSMWLKKAVRIMEFVLEVGNFGHNREHAGGQSFLMSKLYTLRRRTEDSARHFMIFPGNASRIWLSTVIHGAKTLFHGGQYSGAASGPTC